MTNKERRKGLFSIDFYHVAFVFTFVLNESTTDAALPVQLIRINPKQRAAWAKPKRANTLAPAPSPNPMTYLTCKKSNTVTKSSPSVFNDGKLNLNQNGNSIIQSVRKKGFRTSAHHIKEDKKKIGEKLRIGKCISVISMTRNIDMNETWTFFNFRHTWTVYELLERCICVVAIGKKRKKETENKEFMRHKRVPITFCIFCICTRPVSKFLDRSLKL